MYCYISDDVAITNRIKKFHLSVDKTNYVEQQLLIAEGATSIIYLFCLWLINNNIKQIYYIPPMYFLFHKHFEFFSIDVVKVSEKQVYEEGCDFSLPNKRTVLIFSDPVWYAGVKYKKKHIDKIIEWQLRTESFVFVDGSFQYLDWNGIQPELTSILPEHLTFRLISPVKALAINSSRFAYLVLPQEYRRFFCETLSNIFGSSTYSNILFAREAMHTLIENKSSKVVEYAKHRFSLLTKLQTSIHIVQPDCGYFIFFRPKFDIGDCIYMDQRYFEQSGYPGFMRLNLLKKNAVEYIISKAHQVG